METFFLKMTHFEIFRGNKEFEKIKLESLSYKIKIFLINRNIVVYNLKLVFSLYTSL